MKTLPGKTRALFDRPELVLGIFIVGSVILWTIQCSIFQSVLGIDIYETIVWGEELQWGHSKHPPLSGWLGYFFSWVTGHSDWGLYLGAQLCIGLGVFFTYLTARLFFDRFRAVSAALLLYFLLYYTPSEMKFCTYLVEIAVAPAATYLLIRSLREKKSWLWAALGAVCGLGILNKYSFGLIITGFLIVVLTRREYRRCLKSPGPYLALAVFLAVISPHLKWLIDHHFVCFRHVESRLDEEHNVLMPLFVLGAALYPVVMEALAMAVAACLVGNRSRDGKRRLPLFWRRTIFRNLEALRFAAIVSLLPGAVYLLLAFFGTDIILMWLCSVASLSGIVVVAICPVEFGSRLLKRLSILLAVFILAVFAGMTVDVLCRTADGVHMDPKPVVEAAETFWRSHSSEPIPVVVGGFRFAALVDHYSSMHPPVCDPEDDVMIGLYRDRIRKNGALLIDSRTQDFDEFLKRAGGVKVKFRSHRIKFGSRFGKTKTRYFVLGYLPPGTEIK